MLTDKMIFCEWHADWGLFFENRFVIIKEISYRKISFYYVEALSEK